MPARPQMASLVLAVGGHDRQPALEEVHTGNEGGGGDAVAERDVAPLLRRARAQGRAAGLGQRDVVRQQLGVVHPVVGLQVAVVVHDGDVHAPPFLRGPGQAAVNHGHGGGAGEHRTVLGLRGGGDGGQREGGETESDETATCTHRLSSGVWCERGSATGQPVSESRGFCPSPGRGPLSVYPAAPSAGSRQPSVRLRVAPDQGRFAMMGCRRLCHHGCSPVTDCPVAVGGRRRAADSLARRRGPSPCC